MKAVVFLADGFEECEGLIAVDILRRAGVETVMASVMGRLEIESSRNIRIEADVLAEDVDFDTVDMIVLPGGRTGTENLGKNRVVREQCAAFAAAETAETGCGERRYSKYVAAVCAAPSLLAAMGLLAGRQATCHPDFEGQMAGAALTGRSVTVCGNIVTGQGLGASFDFAFELVRLLTDDDNAGRIKRAICYRG